jgi:hypothetical protein
MVPWSIVRRVFECDVFSVSLNGTPIQTVDTEVCYNTGTNNLVRGIKIPDFHMECPIRYTLNMCNQLHRLQWFPLELRL